jgi:translocation and assembly module TamB
MGIELQGEPAGSLSGKGVLSHKQGLWNTEGDFQVDNGALYGESFDSARGRLHLSEQVLDIANCEVVRRGAKAVLQGKMLLNSRALDFKARVEDFSLNDLVALREKQLSVVALASAYGEIRGTLDQPAFNGSFNLLKLQYESWNLGLGKGTINLKDRILEVAGTVQSDLGSFKVQAHVSMEPGYAGKAHFDFKDWNARKVITGEIPPYLKELSTALEGTLDVEGPFGEPAKLTVRGEMDGARFKINEYELRNAGKMRFTVSGQRARVEEFKLIGEGSELALSGTLPLDNTSNLSMRLDGVVDLKALQPTNSKLVAAGTTNVNVRATGSLRNPQIIGQAILNNCRFDYGDSPLHFTAVQGDLTFSSYTVRVENVRGKVASGSFQVSGFLEHQNAEIRNINLQLSAHGVRLPYPKDFRTTLDADLVLRGSPDTQVLTGNVSVLRAEYLRDFNLLEQLTGRTVSTPGPLVADPLLASIRLDISIRSEDGLKIDNELLRLEAGMQLTLRGTPAYPSLIGRVEANEGSIFFRGNRFEIVRAAADFVDRNRINPKFEVRAEADVKSYRLILDVNGDLDNLRSNIRSDPPMATVDIVSLLATGKARDQGQSSRRQAEITGVSAASILSESLTGVIGKRVGRLFGLESFRVDPFLAGVENDPTARVTISERLSKDFAITFSRNLSTDEEQIIVLEYDVNRNLSIIATRDEDGKFGVDFRFRKRFK